ncbi:hypothetical protein MKW98_032288 [Papaver atlanticum]|uniref:ENTH domain-containing protein n=1 Tax=Papaver atlanticum TaxID=357466 RepID=A0AAD4SFN2_9MAGN|nr:hypothetical protein MKW98_032288 [Papaver atlanticum]
MGGQSKIVKALGAVKDQTSISLAKVSNDDTVLADIDVAIVKATRHEECPADERHVREILSLTCYSRAYVSACVHTLSRRLSKTKNWVVALKTLMLIHRLVSEGDSAYEQEIYIATRRGCRLLNLSDFRDTASSSGSWDFSSFVRTYGLYLDERLEYRMQSRRRRSQASIPNVEGETKDCPQEVKEEDLSSVSVEKDTKKKLERVFNRAERLQLVLERFLACRPTGEAKCNRMVIIALYPLVKESFQIYFDLAKIVCFFVEQFMELDVPVCTRVHELFTRIGKQFEDLDVFYEWCKSMGIARSGDYPEIEKITHQKLEIMEEFIREKSNLVIYKRAMSKRQESMKQASTDQEDGEKVNEEDPNEIKALPPPEDFDAEKAEEDQNADNQLVECKKEDEDQKEADLLNLFDDETMARSEEQVNKLALALFDGWSTEVPTNATTSGSAWTAFEEDSGGDWETALVESASHLSNQQATFGGGFDMLVLDGMYQQSIMAPLSHATDNTGSASSVALRPVDPKQPVMLALPSSSTPNEGSTTTGSPWVDPFAASTSVAPPSYVQMSEMERKQKLLVEEQLMWQQYGANGMQGHINGITNTKQPGYYATGSYT